MAMANGGVQYIIENPQCNNVTTSVYIFFQVQTLSTKIVFNLTLIIWLVASCCTNQDSIFQKQLLILGHQIDFQYRIYITITISQCSYLSN